MLYTLILKYFSIFQEHSDNATIRFRRVAIEIIILPVIQPVQILLVVTITLLHLTGSLLHLTDICLVFFTLKPFLCPFYFPLKL